MNTRAASQDQWKAPAPLDASPAGMPWPEALPVEEAQRTPWPKLRALARNDVVRDRFASQGQQATYTFFAEAGELSLFEVGAYGYQRGSAPKARFAVLDSRSGVRFETLRSGGASWRAFWSFVAPERGQYRCVLGAREEAFRYVLVRHSNYAPRSETPIDLLGRESVHGYLSDVSDVAVYRLSLEQGEKVAIKLTGTREEARLETRKPLRGRGAMAGRRQFQTFVLETSLDGETVVEKGPFAFFRAQRAGDYRIAVSAADPRGDGGLFDLALERNPRHFALRGVVVDREDRPVPDVQLQFLREPDRDPMGSCRASDQGTYTFEIPGGDMQVRMRRDGKGRSSTAHTFVAADGELNFLWLQ